MSMRRIFLLALAAPYAQSFLVPQSIERTQSQLFAKVGKGKKLAGASQADMLRQFEEAKFKALQEKNLEVAKDLGASPMDSTGGQQNSPEAPVENLEANTSWRKSKTSQTAASAQQASDYQDFDALVEATPRTLQDKFSVFDGAGASLLEMESIYASTPLGASVQYLKVRYYQSIEIHEQLGITNDYKLSLCSSSFINAVHETVSRAAADFRMILNSRDFLGWYSRFPIMTSTNARAACSFFR